MSQGYTKSGDLHADEKILMPYTYIQQVPGKQIRTKLTSAFNYWLKVSHEKLHAIGEIVQMLHNSSLLGPTKFVCCDCQIPKQHCVSPQPSDCESSMYTTYDAISRNNSSFPHTNTNKDTLIQLRTMMCRSFFGTQSIDDIQDNSILRRGIPVAHSIYGVASTINAANYVMIIALEKSLELGHPLATAVYTEQLLELHRGQGMEIYWRDNFQCPSEDEYKQMTIKKTGGLFMLAIRLMQLFSDNKSDFSRLAAIFGLYFQIRDDYCNLCLQEYSENKSYCEDLTEGKFSFPIIHAIRNQKGDNQVLHILRQRTRDVEVKRYCISLLERLGSFAYTRDTLTQLDADARAEVAALGGNPLLEALLDDLLSWRRDKQHDSITNNV